jgi:hypothetical protein
LRASSHRSGIARERRMATSPGSRQAAGISLAMRPAAGRTRRRSGRTRAGRRFRARNSMAEASAAQARQAAAASRGGRRGKCGGRSSMAIIVRAGPEGGSDCSQGRRSFLLSRLFSNVLQMFKVTATARRAFIGDKIVERNEMYRNAKEGTLDPIWPRASEVNAINVR